MVAARQRLDAVGNCRGDDVATLEDGGKHLRDAIVINSDRGDREASVKLFNCRREGVSGRSVHLMFST